MDVNITFLNLIGWKGNLLICCVKLLSFLSSPGKYLEGRCSGNFSGFLVAVQQFCFLLSVYNNTPLTPTEEGT